MIRRKDCIGQQVKNLRMKDPTIVDALNHIPCPCSKCKNCVRKKTFWVKEHLFQHQFMEDYINWTIHGNDRWSDSSSTSIVHDEELGPRNPYVDMVIDAASDQLNLEDRYLEEDPNLLALKFYTWLRDADKPLWDGCHKHTKLSIIIQLLNLKSEFNMRESCYDQMIKIVNDLCLGYEKIDACPNHCMLYDKENKDLKYVNTHNSSQSDRDPTNKVKDNLRDIGGPMTRLKTQIMKQSLPGLSLGITESLEQSESEAAPKWVMLLQVDEDWSPY
ncbi:hypothetical protein CR513_60565, partial [Mucuna pruriens]